MSIEPTIGRVVWYTPSRENIEGRHFGMLPLQPLAAIVTYVHQPVTVDPDTGRDVHYVNLCVFSQIGSPVSCQQVLLRQPEDRGQYGGRDFCEWMPYQVGQAAKNAIPPAVAPLPFDPPPPVGVREALALLNPSPPQPPANWTPPPAQAGAQTAPTADDQKG